MVTADAQRATEQAGRYIAAGAAGISWSPLRVHLLPALMVVTPQGEPKAWFIPAQAANRLVGYLLLDLSLELIKDSTFIRHPGALSDCPELGAWIDPAAISRAAIAFLGNGFTVDAPILSFDGVLDRLAWRVRCRDAEGGFRTVCVAGRYVFDCA